MDLIFQQRLSFTHLDWHDVRQWLDMPDTTIRVAWERGHMTGIIAASPPLYGTVWIRLVALTEKAVADEVFRQLWRDMCGSLRANGIHTAAVLVIDDWLLDYIPQNGFAYEEDIVTLCRIEPQPLPDPESANVRIRSVHLEDVPRIVKIDQTAFYAPWQMSIHEIRQARRIAAYCTLAEIDRVPVGYQLSTMYQQTGHLARLAVLPEVQGKGVGSALLYDLLSRLQHRRVETITVNTQAGNVRSQRLYERFGFQRNGYDLPVWIAAIN